MANWVLLLLLFLSCDDVLASWLGCDCVDVWEDECVGRLRIDWSGLASSGDPTCGGDRLEAKWTRWDVTDGTKVPGVKELNSLWDGWSETVVGEGARSCLQEGDERDLPVLSLGVSAPGGGVVERGAEESPARRAVPSVGGLLAGAKPPLPPSSRRRRSCSK